MGKRAYHGDLRLYSTPRIPVEAPQRGVIQEFPGWKAERMVYVPTSPCNSLTLTVKAFMKPYPGSETQLGLRGTLLSHRKALWARSHLLAPVCWIADDSLERTVASAGGLIIETTAAHPYVATDYVLIRRNGVSLYTLINVTSVPDTTHFVVPSLTHSVLAGDKVLRVDLWWSGMYFDSRAPVEGNLGHPDFYAEEGVYVFKGGPTAEYARPGFDPEA